MAKHYRFFQNRSARQTFFMLIAGILLLQVAVLFVFAFYWDLEKDRYSPPRTADLLLRTALVSRVMPQWELKRSVKQLRRAGLVVTISETPAKGAQPIYNVKPDVIRQLLEQQGKHANLSIPIANHKWLNARRQPVNYSWMLVGCILLFALLLMAMLGLCAWGVKRLAIPVKRLAQAADRFGRDMQAPPIPETGSDELRSVTRSFNQMQERIRRLMHDRTQMLAAISHDLRTPLTRLQLRAEYLKGTPQYEKALTDLQDMDRMIASILFFARDSARVEAKEWFDINALLETLCNDMVDAGQPVRYHEHDQRVRFQGDLIGIKRALTNLIENGVKYGKQADVNLIIEERQLRIKINDTGPGIPPSEMDRVFSPFYRVGAERSPQISGTGLGLAVARDLIRAHGGDITLQNRTPKGLMVIVDLPKGDVGK